MGNNTLTAINSLIALTELSQHLATEIGAAGESIRQAQAEGRDLSDDELAAIESRREAAVDAWNNRAG